jgi:hypothetical protein
VSRTLPSWNATTASFSGAVAWRAASAACLLVQAVVLLSVGKIRDWIVDDAAREEILVARLAAQQIVIRGATKKSLKALADYRYPT